MFCPSVISALQWNRELGRQLTTEWEGLLGTDHTLHCRAQEEIFQQGRPAHEVFFLAHGLVLLYCDLPEGDESVLGVRFPGQILEHCAHAFQVPYPLSARTLVPSTLYRLPASVAAGRESAHGEVGAFFQRLLRFDLYNAAHFIVALKTTSIADRLERVGRLIAAAVGRAPAADGVLRTSALLRDEQLAGLIGCSVRQFKRVKKDMQQQGRLRMEGKTIVLNTAKRIIHD